MGTPRFIEGWLAKWRAFYKKWKELQYWRRTIKKLEAELLSETGWRRVAEREKEVLEKTLADMKDDPLTNAKRLLALADELFGNMSQGDIDQYLILSWRADYRSRSR